ncbi:DNA primase [Candidatus Saccharibacteria bacterium RIFCSPHIGHO2_12_FULL_41_12]|nr:MAG: DNA primase [Candidatus Saccharibacteria bacterium RIFCSPHIGHO2_12_FULL_41_12]
MDAVSDIKARLNIEDVIGEYVRLKRTGRSYKGLSPFTSEKTPSFVVSPEKNIWHDFSSGKGGDMFSFIMEVESVDFKGALELLARKAGVDLDKYQANSGQKQSKDPLYKILEDATHFYQKSLLKNKKALDYLSKQRKFSKQTIIDFLIGYSPAGGRELIDYLMSKNHKMIDIVKVGLVSKYNNENQDMFRGRIMLPLADSFGRVIGFTARLLDDKPNAPKYINTPSTILYDKSRHVYGLHLAKQEIKKQGFSVVVEGNLDVVSSHQVGIKNVVAIAGTALTKYQTKILAGLSENIRLGFDQDRAGLKAAERSLEVVADQSVNLCMITVPKGQDPDELIQKDPKLWREAIDNYDYAIDWIIKKYMQDFDLSSPIGKKNFGASITDVLKKIKDPIEQEHYINVVSEHSGISSSALGARIAQISQSENVRPLKSVKNKAEDNNKLNIEIKKSIDQILAIMFFVPTTRQLACDLTPDALKTAEQKAVFDFLRTNLTAKPAQVISNLTDYKELSEFENYVKILAVNFEELFQDIETLELQYEAQRLKNKIVEQYVRAKKLTISIELKGADPKKERTLLEQSGKLDKMLKSKKV